MTKIMSGVWIMFLSDYWRQYIYIYYCYVLYRVLDIKSLSCDHLADVAVVHTTAVTPTTTSTGGRVPDLLFGLPAASSDQAAAARFCSFLLLLLLLLELMLVASVTGSASRRTGRRGGSRVLRDAPRRLGVADVRARPALQRARRLVFRSV